MVVQAYLRPTATQRMRGFLDEVGEPLPPWTGADEVTDHLVALLLRRRGDAAFWARLEGLTSALVAESARGTDGLAAPEAEVLSATSIGAVVAELRAALGAAPATVAVPAARRTLSGCAAPVLACVALLGGALAGCSREERPGAPTATTGPSGGATTTTTTTTTTTAAGPVDAAPVAVTTPDALVALFRDGSPEEIAGQLEAMLDAGAGGGPGAGSSGASPAAADAAPATTGEAASPDAAPVARKRPRRPPVVPPIAVPLYKGVSV